MDNWGSKRNAVYLEGMPGMSSAFVRDYLADQTGVVATSKFAQYKELVSHFQESRQPIILDEAHHGLPNKAECIEYLRRIAEQANVILVLVCHSSERHRFGKSHVAHIATRITAAPELKEASEADCGVYLNTLCEVAVDAGIVKAVHSQTGGRYRLISNACRTLEAIAQKKGATALAAADVKGVRLCEDAMAALRKGA